MNVDNGETYITEEQVAAAKARGENVVEVDADSIEHLNRKARRHKKIIEELFGEPGAYTPMDYARLRK